ncbi:helix-turn-helix transcriptional regulator [Streptomyces sp. NBC_00820]|uniref:helix-turn-helix domain-containing protein n=1 Tax=Streptomyces sp. NBC_00820 TaxID=2975842 RepID=UPI002ED0103F|nr:helix-turn-helix transcriptional regulator [Streptomyces sp. NBC_00820]
MTDFSELSDFLRSRRAALNPEDIGLPQLAQRRRVPGLRREEVALAAGLSVTHYTRLEQGRTHQVSDSVLTAIARTLRLTPDEHTHLMDLARPEAPGPRRTPAPRTHHADQGIRQLIDTFTETPALVLDRRNDILAWNAMGHLLLAMHLDIDAPSEPHTRPNLTRMLFLDERNRDLYPHWDDEAQLAVASLRLVAGRHPHDKQLAELVGDLIMNSDDFAGRWARHPVRTCVAGIKEIHHPLVGEMELSFQSLLVPGPSEQRLITYSARPGTTSEAGLRLLAATLQVPYDETARTTD